MSAGCVAGASGRARTHDQGAQIILKQGKSHVADGARAQDRSLLQQPGIPVHLRSAELRVQAQELGQRRGRVGEAAGESFHLVEIGKRYARVPERDGDETGGDAGSRPPGRAQSETGQMAAESPRHLRQR